MADAQIEQLPAAFQRSIDVNPRNYRNHYIYAAILARLQDWRGAAGEFQKTLALDPAHGINWAVFMSGKA